MGVQYLSEIRIMSFNFAPRGWALCNGQLMPINQAQALFSLLGTTYGGDGRVTFGLPNLQGRVPLGFNGAFVLGQMAGETTHTLIASETPAHTHALMTDAITTGTTAVATATSVLGIGNGQITPSGTFNVNIYNTAAPNTALHPASISNVGGSQPHQNMQPYLTLNFCIALQGIFPSRN
jgi:microcystin-dependent protein